jgi:predicted transcriptional regulator
MSDSPQDSSGRLESLMELATEIVAAYVSHNQIPMNEIPNVIRSVHQTLGGLGGGMGTEPATAQKPAVPVKKSVTPEHIICLEDGAKLKMLKRYLRSKFDLTPEQYRAKWGLPSDYPMVAPNYAKQRSEFAKQIGLGTVATQTRPRDRRKRAA